jgi:HKD family nuclease
MSRFVWEKGYIKKMSMNLNITQITIVSAFFSSYGLEVIRELKNKNNIPKEKINIYLSTEFSMIKPGEILDGLCKIANVYIVTKVKLHAKVFMFYTEKDIKVFHGSANFTRGGVEDNLELTNDINLSDIGRLEEFENYCKKASEKVTPNIVQKYRDIDTELEEYLKASKKANKRFVEIFKDENDPFTEADYDFENYFFKFHHYETFFPKYQYLDGPIINQRRDVIRKKLYEINRDLKNELQPLNLHNHWASVKKPEYITSKIDRSDYNHNRLSWICVRYGKHKKDAIIEGGAERYESFIKHACMQLSIVSDGMQIGLFHATANKAIDRDYLHKNINKLKHDISSEISMLKGEGLVWHIYDPKSDKSIKKFNIDQEDAEKFVDFYRLYDKEGYESFCIYHMYPNDYRLETKESIIRVATKKITKLHPLYKLITWVIPH